MKINITLLKAGISFIKYQIKLRTELLEENSNDKWLQYIHNKKDIFKTLVKMGQYEFSNQNSKTQPACDWSIPSLYFEYKVVTIMKNYGKVYPQAKMDGVGNVWVVKPSFTSRGIGVHCINAPNENLYPGKKMQAKVIQKYIERTFLLLLPNSSGKLEGRKFDIRQWVLVTSFSPLTIYMFNSCYLKICGSEYSLAEFKDKYRHISNYTVQKNNNRISDTKSELIMSIPQFVAHLWEHFKIKLDWKEDMQPKLANIIKHTMYAGFDVVKHKSNCFELYGFDFVFDYKLNPWLIEVNMSPACSERTDWLVEMLGTPFI